MARSRRKITGYIAKGKRTKEYMQWGSMKSRCSNLNDKDWSSYGGRGIDYHPDWEYFENFIEDMGPCPPEYSLDRIDNDGPYSPDNCRWASHMDQHRNKRNNVNLTADGRTQMQEDWARELGVSRTCIYLRRTKGQTMQEIFDALRTGMDRYQVKNIEFSTRCLSVLDEIEIADIRSLSLFNRETFFRVRGVGVKVLHEVEDVMEDLGVNWKIE